MGFGLIFAGMVFFFNPCINIIDILPDFIGCILISAGLYRLADVEDRFFAARQTVNRLIPIYILKFFLSLFIPVAWKSGLLPVTFIYSVGEIILMLMLCTTLYGGIEYVSNLHNGDIHLKSVGNVSKLTIIFMIVKNVLAFIPEAFVLGKDPDLDLSYRAKPSQTLLEAKPFVIVFFTAAVLIFGIFCFTENLKFFKKLAADKKFNANLYEIYKENVLDNSKKLNRRRFGRFFILMAIGAVLTYDVVIDAVNILPDIIAYSVMFAAVICLGAKKESIQTGVLFVPLALISAASFILRIFLDSGVNYAMHTESYLVNRNSLIESGNAVIIGGILAAVEAALFVMFMSKAVNSAAKLYADATGEYIRPAIPTVIAAVIGVLSIGDYIVPFIKAKFYSEYINDTLVNSGMLTAAKNLDAIQIALHIILLLVTAFLAYYFISMRRKADIEL